MVQVRRSCCARTVHADLPGIQLAVAFQLVSSCSVRRSLHRPSGFVSHLSGCHHHRSGASDRARWLPSQPARPDGSLALHLDLAHSFQRRRHSRRVHSLSHRTRRLRQRPSSPEHSRCALTRPARPNGLLARFLDTTRLLRRRAASRCP